MTGLDLAVGEVLSGAFEPYLKGSRTRSFERTIPTKEG
jgi:hypothetical protein